MLLTLAVVALLQDPEAILKQARSAQAEFERTRRFHLPRTTLEPSRRCDERIGGLCYWYDATETPPPPEGAEITGARAALLVELSAAVARVPDDPWPIGQQVRYLLEADRPGEALQAAAGCASTSAWCGALVGLVHHWTGEGEEADSAFTRALRRATAEERCAWLDIRLLLPGGAAREWRNLPCPARADAAERWLEFGRPLLARAGNSVRTEFLARQVLVHLADGTLTPYGFRFDDTQRELVLRYGWPIGWSQEPGRGGFGTGSVIGHDPSPAWGFVPRGLEASEVDLADERPLARFKPPGLAAIFGIADVQLARLPRADGTLLVAAWQLPPASPLNTEGTTAVLAGKPVGEAPVVAGRFLEGRGGVVTALAGTRLESAGLELLTADGAIWGRHREVWEPPLPVVGPMLSDLLLFEPGELVPDRLEEVLPRMIRGRAIRRGGQVGLYWEWSGLPAGEDSVTVRIQVRPQRGGDATLAWSWPVPAPVRRDGRGSMSLDLARLGRGTYLLEVVLTAGTRVLRSQRPFQVT